MEAGGWCAGPWPGWVTQHRPYPHPPWGSPSHTHQAEERSHCPSFPDLSHWDRTWGLTPGPLSSRPGETGVAWTPGPRSARQGAKDTVGEAGSLVGGLPPTFGVIVVLVVLGAPSSSRRGGDGCGPCPKGSLDPGREQLSEAPASQGLAMMTCDPNHTPEAQFHSVLEFSWPSQPRADPLCQLGKLRHREGHYARPSSLHVPTWLFSVPDPGPQPPPPPSRHRSPGAPLSHTRELSKRGLWRLGL